MAIFLWKYKSVQSVIGKGDILFILFLTPPFFYTPPVVSCLYAGIFRRYLVDVDHHCFHPQK